MAELNYVPLNDYILVQVEEAPPTELVDMDEDKDAIQSGTVIHAGKHSSEGVQSEQDTVEVGDIVEWVMFSGSGRTKVLPDGRRIAQIPFDRLTMKGI